MPWPGNGSRERLWDLPRSVAEDALLPHPSAQDKASRYPLPALLSQNQPWLQKHETICPGDLVPAALHAEFNNCFDLENIYQCNENGAAAFGKSVFSRLLLFPVGPKSSNGNHHFPTYETWDSLDQCSVLDQSIQHQTSRVSKGALILSF